MTYYEDIMYFGGCNYGGVYHYGDLAPVGAKMKHIHVTDEMGYKAVATDYDLFDWVLAPNSYQFLMVHDDQSTHDLALSFVGFWDGWTLDDPAVKEGMTLKEKRQERLKFL